MGGFGFGGLGPVSMIIFWGLLIVGVVFVVRWLIQSSGKGRPDREADALEILKQRYARGEIDRQEYQARKRDLEA